MFKLAVGLSGHSAALIADAVHSLSDIVANIALMLGLKYSEKPIDDTHHYGHGKYETLSTLVTGDIILIAAAVITWENIQKVLEFYHGEILPTPSRSALIVAIICVVIKEVLYRYTIVYGKRLKSNALMALAIDHRTDAIFSVGAAIGIGIASVFGGQYNVCDPAAAIILGIFVMKLGFDIIYQNINELMEASIDKETFRDIENKLRICDGVKCFHNLKTRKVGRSIAVDVHIKVDKDLNIIKAHDISRNVETCLKDVCGSDCHISVHIEPFLL